MSSTLESGGTGIVDVFLRRVQASTLVQALSTAQRFRFPFREYIIQSATPLARIVRHRELIHSGNLWTR